MFGSTTRVLRGSTLAAAVSGGALIAGGVVVVVISAALGEQRENLVKLSVSAAALALVGAAAAGLCVGWMLRSFTRAVSFDDGLRIDGVVCRVGEFQQLVTRAHEANEILAAQSRNTEKLEALHLRSAEIADNTARETAVRLHDDVLQTVIATRFQLESGNVEGCVEWLERAEEELRAVAFGLAPSIASGGLSGALAGLCARRSTGASAVLFTDTCQSEVAPAATHTLMRAATEVISNAQLWGHATEVRVTLSCSPGHTDLTVTDNGVGFNTEAHHDNFGLFAIATEVDAFGGTLDVRSEPGKGTAVTIHLPAPTDDADDADSEPALPAAL